MRYRPLLWLLLAAPLWGQETKTPLRLQQPLRDKNFYILSLMERSPAARTALEKESLLAALAASRAEALHSAAANCLEGVDCFLTALRFSEAEMTQAASALKRLYAANAAIRNLIDVDLRRSGAYVRWRDRSGPELLEAAWLDAAGGVNRIIDVYGAGKPPRYPAIDSVSFDIKSQAYRQMVHAAVDLMDERRSAMRLFSQAPLEFAMRLLEINHRDEAARFEPMESGENASAIRKMAGLRWSDYPYTMIVVPGAGSDRTTWTLSGAGRMRCEIAARRYRNRQAPFILVSGGFVHPNQTPNCEALEMKRVLIKDFGIPAEAIIIDPHARHTTTNLRNAARLMYRYGVPFENKALIVTDRYQSAYIEGQVFAKRCQNELGYLPYRLLGRTSVFDLEFLPLIESLHIDPADPLDP